MNLEQGFSKIELSLFNMVMERRHLWDCPITNSNTLVQLNWDQTHFSLKKNRCGSTNRAIVVSRWQRRARPQIFVSVNWKIQHKVLTVKFGWYAHPFEWTVDQGIDISPLILAKHNPQCILSYTCIWSIHLK